MRPSAGPGGTGFDGGGPAVAVALGIAVPRAFGPKSIACGRPAPFFEDARPFKLRCVESEPRRLSLLDLGRGDCRYPYGGDEEGEAISFCGHPRQRGSSYCTPHFHLTRNPALPSEPAERLASPRTVEPA
jgi:GcrA cell cycle regulator